jgi:hypothetical protein
MAQVRVTINTDNDAFGDDPRPELSRILRELASIIEEYGLPDYARRIADQNGNECGMLVSDYLTDAANPEE